MNQIAINSMQSKIQNKRAIVPCDKRKKTLRDEKQLENVFMNEEKVFLDFGIKSEI